MVGVLCDLDQTLLDRTGSLCLFLDDQWHRHTTLQTIPAETFIARFLDHDKNGRVWKDVVYRQMLEEFQIKDVHARDLTADYVAGFGGYARLFPDASEVLRRLKEIRNFRLGIITNGRGDLQSSVVRATGLDALMETVLVSEIEGIRKPEVAIFERAARRLGLPPSDCVFVGDDPEADVGGAASAGMRTIWKTSAPHRKQAPQSADAVISKFAELEAAIDRTQRGIQVPWS